VAARDDPCAEVEGTQVWIVFSMDVAKDIRVYDPIGEALKG
jgi:hypothetical protein